MSSQYVDCPYCGESDQNVEVDDDSNALWNCNKCEKPMVVVTKTSVKVRRVEGYYNHSPKRRRSAKKD